MEGYINLFTNEYEGTTRPHFKGFLKIDGVDHEFALWPAREGKKGYSGKYKPKDFRQADTMPTEQPKVVDAVDDAEIPF